jgi:hypothetical protein
MFRLKKTNANCIVSTKQKCNTKTVKVKVMLALEQTTKAQSGTRGIALVFL